MTRFSRLDIVWKKMKCCLIRDMAYISYVNVHATILILFLFYWNFFRKIMAEILDLLFTLPRFYFQALFVSYTFATNRRVYALSCKIYIFSSSCSFDLSCSKSLILGIIHMYLMIYVVELDYRELDFILTTTSHAPSCRPMEPRRSRIDLRLSWSNPKTVILVCFCHAS